MPLLFRARKSNMKSKDGKKKWHPVLVKVGRPVSLVDMAEEVAEKASLTQGDTLSAVRNLMKVMSRYLLNSRSVRLDGLGTFTVVSKSGGNGVDTEEEVSSEQISGLRILFKPEYTRNKFEGTTRAMFSKVEFAKWGGKASEKSSDDNGDNNYIDPEA